MKLYQETDQLKHTVLHIHRYVRLLDQRVWGQETQLAVRIRQKSFYKCYLFILKLIGVFTVTDFADKIFFSSCLSVMGLTMTVKQQLREEAP